MSLLSPIAIKRQKSNYTPTIEELINCQQAGNKYFNYIENNVGTSDLLGVHKSGKWVTGFAETCESILNVYVDHINFLRSYQKILNINIEPNKYSYANMQRMVKEYLPTEAYINLKNRFIENKLPIHGFEKEEVSDMKETPIWQLITGLVIGFILLLVIIILALFIPEPKPFQSLIFRGTFAIALAGIGAIIPGFLNVNSRYKKFSLRAGGAIAIFIIVWFINPPALI